MHQQQLIPENGMLSTQPNLLPRLSTMQCDGGEMQALQCMAGLLESAESSITLNERGDTKPLQRHPDFRLFAAMNPATDAGMFAGPSPHPDRAFQDHWLELLSCVLPIKLEPVL